MKIRLGVVIVCLTLVLIAAWFALACELVKLLPFTGDIQIALTLTVFVFPLIVIKELLS